MTTREELKLLLDNNRDNKGARQLLLKNLDNMVAKYFESPFKNSGDGRVVLSVTKWLKDGGESCLCFALLLFVLP
jgi:hypothetical protein